MDNGLTSVLQLILTRLEGRGVNWALTGSMSFAIQGVPVNVRDIDIQSDRTGAYEIERCLSEFVRRPVSFSSTERVQSHFGLLSIMGVDVEIMGDIQKRLPDGTWDAPVDPSTYRTFVEFAGVQVPVLSLAYEHRAYLALGRTEKARLLEKWLRI